MGILIVRASLGADHFISNPVWTDAIANDHLTNLKGLAILWKQRDNPRDRAFLLLMARKVQAVIHNVFWQGLFSKKGQAKQTEDIGELHRQFHDRMQKLVELVRGYDVEIAPYYFH
ncbi:hypothetical protein SISSUDRAFT_754068 [Sistotremastrum suecicum HHB10207 ss-3]|nr:hypothetical protein SISSUDRAFT_754068 [Sistotremastrum suecicum HHB10207 ss-3]